MNSLIILLLLLLCLFIYMMFEAFGNTVKTHEVVVEGQDKPLSLFFISDTHNRVISKKVLAPIRGKVDYIIIGGDFVDKRTSIAKMEKNMASLAAIAPTYFVWGNNDKEADQAVFLNLLSKYNIQIICNASVLLRDRLRLCAIDFNGTSHMIKQSLEGCEVEDRIIFVSHDPHRFNKVTTFIQPMLFLAGHLHGGQVRLGRFGMFQKGSFEKNFNTYQLISNGYGTTLLPIRLGAKAESHIIHIRFQ